MRTALARSPSLETRRRIEEVLAPIESRLWTGDQLRLLRAIHVLELIATPEAREQLARLAGGDPAAPLTREAAAALSRIRR